MARKAPAQREPVSHIVEKKALAALEDYRADFARAQQEAASIVARLSSQFPDSSERIRQLFDNCEFRVLQRLQQSLRRSRDSNVLDALTHRVEQGLPEVPENPAGTSFDDYLQQQENAVVQTANTVPGELKSTRHFRASLAKQNAEKLVSQAIEQAPRDCGPLNPQMLAIRSLSTMRDLSPHYLNRFVSYIDTLFWLEQADNKTEQPTRKKRSGAPTAATQTDCNKR